MTGLERTRATLHALSLIAAVTAGACTQHETVSQADSQGHWLRACEDDSACGELSCLCGVCTTLCSSEMDCPSAPGVTASCVAAAERDACAQLGSDDQVCVPACEGDDCSSSSVVRANGFIPSDAKPVPACGLARATSLPPFFLRTEMADYDGFATVNQITENRAVVLIPNGVVGGNFELRFNLPPPAFLSLGVRVHALFRRVGSANAEGRLLVLRAEDGTLLAAMHTGGDGMYQAGLFEDADTAGVAVELTMACQSPESHGCFINQVQAEYRGLFRADTMAMLDSPSVSSIEIAKKRYRLDFSSTSVDGDGAVPGSSCAAAIVPARYLEFQLLLDR